MSVTTHYCQKKCCKIFIKKYNHIPRYFNRNYKKAGAFIFDPKQNRVLLVQSRGHLFGPPKGTLNINEQDEHCAVREVKEETGLDILAKDFTKAIKIKNRAMYYYLEMDTCPINVQDTIVDNDANGITWIKISCLEQEIANGSIVLNHYAKILFQKLLGIIFPKSKWITIRTP
jgi:ADP-ribose pyrophosphatase YjhB (NUDIX family)